MTRRTAAPRPRAPKPSKALRAKVLQRDRGICWLCGKPGARTLDHVKPSSHGGSTTYANLKAAHQRCNSSRQAPHPVRGTYR